MTLWLVYPQKHNLHTLLLPFDTDTAGPHQAVRFPTNAVSGVQLFVTGGFESSFDRRRTFGARISISIQTGRGKSSSFCKLQALLFCAGALCSFFLCETMSALVIGLVAGLAVGAVVIFCCIRSVCKEKKVRSVRSVAPRRCVRYIAAGVVASARGVLFFLIKSRKSEVSERATVLHHRLRTTRRWSSTHQSIKSHLPFLQTLPSLVTTRELGEESKKEGDFHTKEMTLFTFFGG